VLGVPRTVAFHLRNVFAKITLRSLDPQESSQQHEDGSERGTLH
jgi:hypothetical protein